MRELFLAGDLVVAYSEIDEPLVRAHTWYGKVSNTSGKIYVATTVKIDGRKTTRYLHRMIVGCGPSVRVDHQDRNTLNCQRGNLRIATHYENNSNRGVWGHVSYKGVDRPGRRFRARITYEGIIWPLGVYDAAEDAARAYDAQAHRLFGEFAYLNFPEDYPRPTYDQSELEIPFL